MLYYFKKGKSAIEMQRNYLCCAWGRYCDWSNVSKLACGHRGEVCYDIPYMWNLKRMTQKKFFNGLQSFMLEMSCWMMLHGQLDQLKFIMTNRHIIWEQSMLCHTGDSWHTQNIQINHWKSFAQAWLCYLLWCLSSM